MDHACGSSIAVGELFGVLRGAAEPGDRVPPAWIAEGQIREISDQQAERRGCQWPWVHRVLPVWSLPIVP